jgi:hypothetical protein
VTWDYGPTAAAIKSVCSPSGSCGYSAGDVNAVIQKSADGGKTWSQITPMGPHFPENGGIGEPLVVQPNGQIDSLVQGDRVINPITYAVKPAYEYFTSSADGGKTWSWVSSPLRVNPRSGQSHSRSGG